MQDREGMLEELGKVGSRAQVGGHPNSVGGNVKWCSYCGKQY